MPPTTEPPFRVGDLVIPALPFGSPLKDNAATDNMIFRVRRVERAPDVHGGWSVWVRPIPRLYKRHSFSASWFRRLPWPSTRLWPRTGRGLLRCWHRFRVRLGLCLQRIGERLAT